MDTGKLSIHVWRYLRAGALLAALALSSASFYGRAQDENGRPRRGAKGPGGGEGRRTPWILVHAPELDTNEDGTVTLQELMDEAHAVFNGYDGDKDKFLSADEMRNARSGVRSALTGFVKQHNLEMDRDADGKVSTEEMADQFRKFFTQADKNGDAKLTADECKVEGKIKPRFPGQSPDRGQPPRPAPTERRDGGSAKVLPAGTPNIVLFLIDDMGWNDTGFSGSEFIETPHLDRLAKDGVVFTEAYSSAPNCAPTRACLLSGQYPGRHGVYTVVDDRHAPGSPHHKMLAAKSNPSMAAEVVTIAEQLKASGYATGMFGMWNLGRGRTGPTTPTGQGFDLFVRPQTLGFDKDRYFADDGGYLTDRLTVEAVTFMEKSRDKPFFAYLAYHAVHAPFEPKPELVEKYRKTGGKNAEYAATVEAVDQAVGRIMKTLARLEVQDNTVVIFTSDNGGNRRSTGPLRSGKGSLYEGGIRVPAAVWGPGLGVVSESTCGAPILSIDFYPTVLDLAGVKANPDHRLDGISLVPALRGGPPLTRGAVFWHFPCYIGGGGPSSAIRKDDYKLIEFFEGRRLELYNLKTDPGENKNLASSLPDKAKELYADLQAWQKETGAALVTKANPNFDPIAAPMRGRDQRGKRRKK